jgi:hypothetical protein
VEVSYAMSGNILDTVAIRWCSIDSPFSILAVLLCHKDMCRLADMASFTEAGILSLEIKNKLVSAFNRHCLKKFNDITKYIYIYTMIVNVYALRFIMIIFLCKEIMKNLNQCKPFKIELNTYAIISQHDLHFL